MAISKITEWQTKDKLILLTAWARDGLTDKQIAKNIGISRQTLYKWKNDNVDILNALKKGKEVVDIEVENALLKKALGYKYDEVTYERVYDKDRQEYIKQETKRVTKEVQPDPLSIFYWLKNRKPDKWKDRVSDTENDEQIKEAKDILVKIRKVADNGPTS